MTSPSPDREVLSDVHTVRLQRSAEAVREDIWALGGRRGWYFGDALWHLRGRIDRWVGGVGLRRGRRHPTEIEVGDAIDCWRVLVADRSPLHLLLLAEMKLPGRAWLAFEIDKRAEGHYLVQTSTFWPDGWWGRLYWYAALPVHRWLFGQMARKLARGKPGENRASRVRSHNQHVQMPS